MMGRKRRDQGRLFYEFRLEDRIPKEHLLRRMNVFVTAALADLHRTLKPFYSDIGRPSIDPELMMRMLVVGYCYGKDQSIGRADAMRRAMLAVMADASRPAEWVPAWHPSVWGPFVVVGEGGAAR